MSYQSYGVYREREVAKQEGEDKRTTGDRKNDGDIKRKKSCSMSI